MPSSPWTSILEAVPEAVLALGPSTPTLVLSQAQKTHLRATASWPAASPPLLSRELKVPILWTPFRPDLWPGKGHVQSSNGGDGNKGFSSYSSSLQVHSVPDIHSAMYRT